MKKIYHLLSFVGILILVMVSIWALNSPVDANNDSVGETDDDFVLANTFLSAYKRIDYLGDDGQNQDTEVRGSDYYRLYLDVKGTAIGSPQDIILLLDHSNSMIKEKGFSTELENDDRITRYHALNLVLKGNNEKETGLINTIFQANKKNRISIKTFNHFGYSITDWMTLEDFDVNKDGIISKSELDSYLKDDYSEYKYSIKDTNIESGFYKAHEQLQKGKSDNSQMLILLSDGLPTVFNVERDLGILVSDPLLEKNLDTFEDGYVKLDPLPSGDYTIHSNICGYGDESNLAQVGVIKEATYYAVNEFKKLHPDVGIATVFMDENEQSANNGKKFLDKLASRKDFSYMAKNTTELEASFQKIAGAMQDVTVRDNLSRYIDFYQPKPDIKITKQRANGDFRELRPEEYQLTIPKSKDEKEISILYNGGMEVDAIYTISFNVKLSQLAKDTLDRTQTGDKIYGKQLEYGDSQTDYDSNQTSSQKAGFYSNELPLETTNPQKDNPAATVTWENEDIWGNVTKLKHVYNRPVVQGRFDDKVLSPILSELQGQKVIDYLGDKGKNPDTKISGPDDYRLYLDVKNKPKKQDQALDLILLVDKSATMNKDFAGIRTIDMIQQNLISKDEQSFINNFLNSNGQNRIGIINYGETAEVALNLSKDINAVKETLNTDTFSSSASNIESALYTASEMIDKNDASRTPVVLLLSAGQPTAYIQAPSQLVDSLDNIGTVLPEEADGAGSIGAAEAFLQKHPSAYLYGTSIPGEITKLMEHLTGSPKRVFTLNGKNQLKEQLKVITGNSIESIEIKDKLTEYVNYDAKKADFSVKLINLITGEQTKLSSSDYQVDLDAVNKNFKVNFKKGLEKDCAFQVSFNIQLSDYAKGEYLKNLEQNLTDGYNGVIGHKDSDYPENHTSSNKPGFHANISANYQGLVDETLVVEEYDHPVVQVENQGSVTVTKFGDKDALPGVTFQISEAEIIDGKWQKKVDGIKYEQVTKLTDSGKAIAIFKDLPLGKYLLTEVKGAVGHELLAKPIQITLPYKTDANDPIIEGSQGIAVGDSMYYLDLSYTINNNKSFVLPDTGKTSRFLLVRVGIGLTIFSLILIIILSVKKYKSKI